MNQWVTVRERDGQNEIWLSPSFVDLSGTAFPQGLRLLGCAFAPGAETDQALSSLESFFAELEDDLREVPGDWETWVMRYMSTGEPAFRGHDYLRLVPGHVGLEATGWPHGISLFAEDLVFADRKQIKAKEQEVTDFMNGLAQAFRNLSLKPAPGAPRLR